VSLRDSLYECWAIQYRSCWRANVLIRRAIGYSLAFGAAGITTTSFIALFKSESISMHRMIIYADLFFILIGFIGGILDGVAKQYGVGGCTPPKATAGAGDSWQDCKQTAPLMALFISQM
jgi:hypothetical protein